MEHIYISDKTLRQEKKYLSLSFREKIELCRLIDRLGVDRIELNPIDNPKADSLLIKSVAAVVQNAQIAVPVYMNRESVEKTWNTLKEASNPRLQICVPVSSVQMEYLYHIKPADMIKKICDTISICREYTDEVELIAIDATRCDNVFLKQVVSEAIQSGARAVTFCDTAGAMLPEELSSFLKDIISSSPHSSDTVFGIDCSDALSMADACAIEAVQSGIREIKAASCRFDCVSMRNIVRILSLKGEKYNVCCDVRKEEIGRITGQAESLCHALSVSGRISDEKPLNTHDADYVLTVHDSKESILNSIRRLGYELSDDDCEKVYQSFMNIAGKKEEVSIRELEAIVAAEAMQVPPAYMVTNYVINTGNITGAMAHMRMKFHERDMDGISTGDGPIDAAFMAIEQAIGKHFELDEFRIQAITEGQEAMGETLVKLRSNGKLYPGRGISTDIVGSSIMAYINALNKIVYEEEEA